jgi:hypothetical protein
VGAFAQEKEPSQNQHQVSPGDLLSQHSKQRRGQLDDPGEGKEQEDTGQHCQAETDDASPFLLLAGQFVGQDRDEHNVVDPENDLEQGERSKANPRLRVGDPVHE